MRGDPRGTSPFRRRRSAGPDGDLGVLLLQGHEMVVRTGQAHTKAWGLGDADRWDLDRTTGLLRFTYPDRVAEAPAQVLGTYSSGSGSWMWAWADESLLDSLCAASEHLRGWGEQNGQAVFTTPRLQVSDEQAADLAALASASRELRASTGRLPGGRAST